MPIICSVCVCDVYAYLFSYRADYERSIQCWRGEVPAIAATSCGTALAQQLDLAQGLENFELAAQSSGDFESECTFFIHSGLETCDSLYHPNILFYMLMVSREPCYTLYVTMHYTLMLGAGQPFNRAIQTNDPITYMERFTISFRLTHIIN